MLTKQETYGNPYYEESLRVNPTVNDYDKPKASGLVDANGHSLVHKRQPVGFVHFDRA